MKSLGAADSMPHLFPSLHPALMIAMGYIDLGKWVAAIEAGARFGYDLVLPVLFFNFSAILCQYLATCITMVTGKNLAEICQAEYGKSACIVLGVQAELSIITSELTMVFGIAHAFNLLFALDLVTCICFATIAANLLPFFIDRMNNRMAETLNIGIAGFALLCYVLGLLVSQPEIPLITNVIFPKLSGESVYSLMALLGANIMAHNFYIHSSMVQEQRRIPVVSIGALFHDHFFAILFIFTGIFLVNYVLMNSAAVASSSLEVLLNFQDVVLLMDQIFVNPMAPVMFLFVLILSSQIISLICNIGGQVIVRQFFGINMSHSLHHLLVNALAIVPAIYCASIAGAEGVYQLLIICQVIQAMLLPSSVVPLFRVASSRLLMGSFKISWYLEILAFLAFLCMLSSSIVFAIMMLFGSSSWMNNLKGNMGTTVVIPYAVLLLISCASIAFTLFLAVTPLKSESAEHQTHGWSLRPQKDQLDLSENKDASLCNEDCGSTINYVLKDSLECDKRCPDNSTLEFTDHSEVAFQSDHDYHPPMYGGNVAATCSSPTCIPEESKSVVEVEWTETLDKVPSGVSADATAVQNIECHILVGKDAGVEAIVPRDKNDEGLDTLDTEKCPGGACFVSSSEDPGSFSTFKAKGSEGTNGSGSLSKLSGLGRAARRQLAVILDEFWGHIFDYHGKLTQEATNKKRDVLLKLDLKIVGSSVRMDSSTNESSKNPSRDAIRGPVLTANSRDLMTPNNAISNMDLSYGLQMGSSSWSQNMHLSSMQGQSSSNSLLDQSGKFYSNLSLPSSGNQFYQPATIHGYQIASILKGINAGRAPYSGIPLDLQQPPKSSASFIPDFGDSITYSPRQNTLGSLGTSGLQNPSAPHNSGLLGETPYYDPSIIETGENVGCAAYTKKYHSSPDISALIAASRNSFLNEGKLSNPIGSQLYPSKLASVRSQYLDPISRSGVPLAFDELSPPNLQRDVFYPQSNLNPNSKSLWSKQPFEQLFGMTTTNENKSDDGASHMSCTSTMEDSEAELLQSLRFCIMKLLKLEGSGWLFRQSGGCDEDLIDWVAAIEGRFQGDTSETNQTHKGEMQHLSLDQNFDSSGRSNGADMPYIRPLQNCGDQCIWRATLVVSFGVWCIHRILELSLVESRPELWGKYTYVLNRLQGILDPAFSKPRSPLKACLCLHVSTEDTQILNKTVNDGKPIKGTSTTASRVLDLIKEVENAVSGRKGRTGTTAGDVAFPKGKENLASVLKRYKRRLANKSAAGRESSWSAKIPTPAS